MVIIQILPAASYTTTEADGAVKLYIPRDGPASTKPVSVYTMFETTVNRFPKNLALCVKRNNEWK